MLPGGDTLLKRVATMLLAVILMWVGCRDGIALGRRSA
jgi:hypothetical protein